MKTMRWLFLLLLVCAAGLAAQQPAGQAAPRAAQPASGPQVEAGEQLKIDGQVVGQSKVPAKAGDVCMLCNHPVDEHDSVYLVNGQRVPLHNNEITPANVSRLQSLLAQLRPRGAFLGADPTQVRISEAWFWFGLYMLVGLLFAAVCAHQALHKGYNPIQWLMAGLFLNIVAYAALLTRPKLEVLAPAGIPDGLGKISLTYAPEACGKCGAENHPSATSCAACGAKLTPKTSSEVVRAGLRAS